MAGLPQAKYRHDYCESAYHITDIFLEFELSADNTKVKATSQVVRNVLQQDVALELDGESLTLLTVQVDGHEWKNYQLQAGKLSISELPEQFSLTIINEIAPIKNTALEGLYLSGDILCTQCEAEGFRHITYYLDRPDVLARFRTKLIADKQRYPYLLSNGNRVAQGELSDGRHWVEWEDPFPKPSYLFALVAGDFDRLTDVFTTKSNRNISLELYVEKGRQERAYWAMDCLKKAMRWDEQRFNLEYDLDIYMIVAVDFFNMGAMENKGLNIFNSKYVLANSATATDNDYQNIESVIGHEYFHNWTGNRVTCRDWFQLSLKEGLTVFRDQEFSADLGSRGVLRIQNVRLLRSAQFAEDASPMAHPIRPDKVIAMNNFYTLTVYEKGAEVIRMLHTLLGEKLFQVGMQCYFQRYDGMAVTCEDFIQSMEEASGQDLTQFRRWYSQSGTPEVSVHDEYDPSKQCYTLTITQFTPPTADQSEKFPLHIPFNIELYDFKGNIIPLRSNGNCISPVLNVTEQSQKWIFQEISTTPTPSFLRTFSAPVKLHYSYTDEQLILLMRYARDEFARWDAAQILLAHYIRINVECYQKQQLVFLPQEVLDAFRGVLLDEKQDPAWIAQVLTIPTEQEIAELFTVIDPEAISAVRKKLICLFADEMQDEWLAMYRATYTSGYVLQHKDIALRSLHNICLYYLAFIEGGKGEQYVSTQYAQANNMTHILGALTAAIAAELPCCNRLMQDFEQHWQADGLVMDKWFSLQATSPAADVLQRVKFLLKHPVFSFNNPNRVRALIGTFCTSNPRFFHDIAGEGYTFLYEILLQLNQSNPQIASRLLDPLVRFKRYDLDRQRLMRETLQKLQKTQSLSRDLYEKIEKALSE